VRNVSLWTQDGNGAFETAEGPMPRTDQGSVRGGGTMENGGVSEIATWGNLLGFKNEGRG